LLASVDGTEPNIHVLALLRHVKHEGLSIDVLAVSLLDVFVFCREMTGAIIADKLAQPNFALGRLCSAESQKSGDKLANQLLL
jgi:hypothetical protein